MTEEDAFIATVLAADEVELLSELNATFLSQECRQHDFGCKPGATPFTEPVGMRGRIVAIPSQFRGDCSRDVGLARDVRVASLLPQMGHNECYYGSAGYPLHPFICELGPEHRALTGAAVLAALKVRDFHSEHIRDLDATSFQYQGYHPDKNDEIHNDFTKQYIFGREASEDEFRGHHGVLKRYVKREQVWYVLLHTPPRTKGRPSSFYVVLLAVGQSPHGDRMLGILTHQICYNLCD